MAPQVQFLYGGGLRDQANGGMIAETNIQKREYQKEYMEYWNSTKEVTGTGRPVDAFIMPVAPFPAARYQFYTYFGYHSIINVLDYASCAVPVTTADKNVDVVDKNFKPVSDEDKGIYEKCKHLLNQGHKSRLTMCVIKMTQNYSTEPM